MNENSITWPADQSLPSFGTPDHLDVVDIRSVSGTYRLLLTTLQGAINRTEPRLYLIRKTAEGAWTWLRDLDVDHTVHDDPLSGASQYLEELTGLIIYDPKCPATINIATTLAGVRDAAVVHPDDADEFPQAEPMVDLQDRFDNRIDAYRWQVEELQTETTDRMLVGLPPTAGEEDSAPASEFRDYPVANSAMTVWFDVGQEAERELFERTLSAMAPNSPYLGWFPEGIEGEMTGVGICAKHAAYVAPTDHFDNMTVFSGIDAELSGQRGQSAESPTLLNKIYVTVTMTEGDNLQYNQHRMREQWNDEARGEVPINWSISPLLVDAAPTVFAYYRRTATENDLLLCGPSGAGYTYPERWPEELFESYARTTGTYMEKADMGTMYLLNRVNGEDAPLSTSTIDAYQRTIDPTGIMLNFWPDRHTDITMLEGGVPQATGPFVDSKESFLAAVQKNTPDGWDGNAPRFLSIAALSWDMMPGDIADAVDRLGADYEVVRGDHFFELFRDVTAEQ